MGKTDRITERQLTILIFVSLLSPMIRILPTSAVVFGGRAAWLSPFIAFVMGKILLGIMGAMWKNAPEGVGLADMAQLGLGGGAGRVFNVLVALWLTFYAGFVCRSAAERLLSTVYPNGSVSVFVITMLIIAVVTATGLTKSLSRTAEVLMPILVAVIAAVLLSAIPDVSGDNLLPVTYRDAKRIVYGALPIFNVTTAFVYFLYLAGHVQKKPAIRPNRFPWLAVIAAVALGVTFFTLGTIGENLAVSMENAFFMVIRNIKVLGVVERVEAVVVAVWIVTDFIFVAALLSIVAEIWRTVTGVKKRTAFVPVTAGIAGIAAFFIARDAFAFQKWSDVLIPAVNLVFTVALIPAVSAVGKLRKKY